MKYFENPDLLPLEDLKLEIADGGVIETIPALHKRWVEDRYFLHYETPKIYNENGTEILDAKNRWIEIVNYMICDLKWLLDLPFYRFWSNVIYNPSILNSLVSILQEAPPFYALKSFPNCSDMLELLETLRRNVLVVFARFVTSKESSTQFMNNSFLGSLLYNNYIFTVPIIFDLCQLYGRENPAVIEKILSALFLLKNSYYDDLLRAIPCLIEAFDNVEAKFKVYPVEHNRPISLEKKNCDARNITLFQLEDIILYVLDISSTIAVLLKNYPSAVNIFHQEGFVSKIISIYGNTIPEMYKKLDEIATSNEDIPKYIEMTHCLDVTRIELINLFRSILLEPICSIQKRLNTVKEEQIKKVVEDHLEFISIAIREKEFITDYNQFYPVDQDLKKLSTLGQEEDVINYNYILKGMAVTIGQQSKQLITALNNSDAGAAGGSGIQNIRAEEATSSSLCMSDAKQDTKSPNSRQLANFVSELKDILSDLDERFIETCLKHYNYNCEDVINAVFENTLPPCLMQVKNKNITVDTLPSLDELISTTYSEDLAFQIQRDMALTDDEDDNLRVIVPKEIEVSKDYITKNYSLIYDDYDDDYDDAYDDHDVRVLHTNLDADSRQFTTPRVFLSKQKKEPMSENDSDQEETEIEQNHEDHFIQNPADIRARAEQHGRPMRGGKHSSNVVGKPKGQGQDKQVLHNRHNKNANKATHANHNRRAGAKFKRQRGMIPS